MIIGAHVGVFEVDGITWQRALGLPLWAMVLASPLAGFLRAAVLDRAVIVIFVVLFGGICALAVSAWRGLYWLLMKRKAARG